MLKPAMARTGLTRFPPYTNTCRTLKLEGHVFPADTPQRPLHQSCEPNKPPVPVLALKGPLIHGLRHSRSTCSCLTIRFAPACSSKAFLRHFLVSIRFLQAWRFSERGHLNELEHTSGRCIHHIRRKKIGREASMSGKRVSRSSRDDQTGRPGVTCRFWPSLWNPHTRNSRLTVNINDHNSVKSKCDITG